jgi:hypothetical protein
VQKFAAMIGKPESEARVIYAKYDRDLPFVSFPDLNGEAGRTREFTGSLCRPLQP